MCLECNGDVNYKTDVFSILEHPNFSEMIKSGILCKFVKLF